MSNSRNVLVVCGLVVLGTVGWLLFGSNGDDAPGPSLHDPSTPVITTPDDSNDTGSNDVGTTTSDASRREIATPAPAASSSLHPSIRAALTGFRGRVVTVDGTPVADAPATMYRFSPDIIRAAGPGPMLSGETFEPDVDAGEDETDDEGRFEIHGVWPDAFYLLRVGLGTDLPKTMLVRQVPGPGEIVDLGDIVVEPSGILIGTVVDEDGQPVAGALVRAIDLPGQMVAMVPIERFDPKGGLIVAADNTKMVVECPPWVERRFEQLPLPTTRTDAKGQFRLAGVVPGSNYFVVTKPALLANVQPSVTVAAGEEKDLGEIELRLGEELFGRVLDTAGEPVANAEIMAASMSSAPIPVHFGSFLPRSDQKGEFQLGGFPNRDVVVAARRDRGDPWTFSEPQPVLRDVEIRLPAKHTLTIEVRSQTRVDLPEPQFQLTPGDLQQGAIETAMWGVSHPVNLSERVSRAEDGRYRIQDLPAGEYALLIKVEDHAVFAASVQLVDDVELRAELEPSRGFDVQVVDAFGKPVAAAQLFVEARGERPRVPEMPFLCGTSDEAGKVHVDSVSATEVRLTAYHPAFGNSHGQSALPAPGPIVLTMGQPASLTGMLTEKGGVPTPGKWTISIQKVNDWQNRGAMPNLPRLVMPDLDGNFVANGLQAGEYELTPLDALATVSSPGSIFNMMQSGPMMFFNQNEAKVTLAPAGTAHVTLDTEKPAEELGPSANISGTLLVDGRPGVGMSVSSWSGGRPSMTKVDEAGRFDLGRMKVGNAQINISDDEQGNRGRMWGSSIYSQRIEVVENVDQHIVIEFSLGSVRGTVRGPSGAPIACEVTATPLSEGNIHRQGMSATSDERGVFHFPRLPAGTYRFTAQSEEAEVTRNEIVVAAGVENVVDLQLAQSIWVRGSVDLASLPTSRWLWLQCSKLGADGRSSESKYTSIDRKTGQFETRELAAGSWKFTIHVQPNSGDSQTFEHAARVEVGPTGIEGLRLQPTAQTPPNDR